MKDADMQIRKSAHSSQQVFYGEKWNTSAFWKQKMHWESNDIAQNMKPNKIITVDIVNILSKKNKELAEWC